MSLPLQSSESCRHGWERKCSGCPRSILAHALVCSLLVLVTSIASRGQVTSNLDRIRKANTLTCGIDQAEAEFSTNEDHGARVAFDQDLCKAVAVAVLGPSARVTDRGYPDDLTALQALRSGEVDLVPTVSSDFTHSAVTSVGFTRPMLYDGIGFLVPSSSGVTRAAGLSQRKICLLAETEVEVEVRAWFAAKHLVFVPFPFQEEGEMEAAFVTGNCGALAGDLTRLTQTRTTLAARRSEFLLLPEVISSDPLAAAFPAADPSFGAIVRWTMEALIEAEQLGLTAENIGSQTSSQNPAVGRLLGATHELGRTLGLRDDWVARTIQSVGNYGQIFDRDLGATSPMGLPRGQNRLATEGGLLAALPFK